MQYRITTGSESFPIGRSNLTVRVVPLRTNPSGPDREIFVTDTMLKSIPSVNATILSSDYIKAKSGSLVDMGAWRVLRMDLREGTILRLSGSRSMKGRAYGSNADIHLNGSLIVRTRDTAPLQKVKFLQVNEPSATFNDVVMEGRFDVLTMKDAIDRGAVFSPQAIKELINGQGARLFTVEELAPEISTEVFVAKERVVNDEGKEVLVSVAQSKRVIDL